MNARHFGMRSYFLLTSVFMFFTVVPTGGKKAYVFIRLCSLNYGFLKFAFTSINERHELMT